MHWYEVLRLTLVVLFVCCSTSLLAVTILRRRQVKDIVRAGRRFVPSRTLLIGVLICVPAVLILFAPEIRSSVGTVAVWCYVIGSIAWLASSFINETIIITRSGLIFPWGYFRQRIGWSQVTDFFVSPSFSGARVVLLWKCEKGELYRYELSVPGWMVEWIELAVESRGTMKDSHTLTSQVRTA